MNTVATLAAEMAGAIYKGSTAVPGTLLVDYLVGKRMLSEPVKAKPSRTRRSEARRARQGFQATRPDQRKWCGTDPGECGLRNPLASA
jgi:hypothetical protein